MAGAYTAKPEAVPDPPDVPDGWNIDWPHPGPLPPGYEPDYTFNVSGPPSVNIGGSDVFGATLVDHETYETQEPSSSTVKWSAKIGSVTVSIRINGGTYANSVNVDYSANGDFWRSLPTLEFSLDGYSGESMTITCQSTVKGYAVSKAFSVDVNPPSVGFVLTSHLQLHDIDEGEEDIYYATIVQRIDADDSDLEFSDRLRSRGFFDKSWTRDYELWGEYAYNGPVQSVDGQTYTVDVTTGIRTGSGYTYQVDPHNTETLDCSATITFNCKIYIGGVLQETEYDLVETLDHQSLMHGESGSWLDIDGDTGVVTEYPMTVQGS